MERLGLSSVRGVLAVMVALAIVVASLHQIITAGEWAGELVAVLAALGGVIIRELFSGNAPAPPPN